MAQKATLLMLFAHVLKNNSRSGVITINHNQDMTMKALTLFIGPMQLLRIKNFVAIQDLGTGVLMYNMKTTKLSAASPDAPPLLLSALFEAQLSFETDRAFSMPFKPSFHSLCSDVSDFRQPSAP